MELTDQEKKLFEEGIVLSADRLMPSKVYINSEEEHEYSAFVYASDFGTGGTLVFKPVHADYEEYRFGETLTSMFTLKFEQKSNSDTSLFFRYDSDVQICDPECRWGGRVSMAGLYGVSLILAAKIVFAEVFSKLNKE